MKCKKAISILLSLAMTAVLVPLAAIPALAADSDENVYTITGWDNAGPQGAIAGVKINGKDLPQSGNPRDEVQVAITLNDGYSLSGINLYGEKYCLALVNENGLMVSFSDSYTKIKLPEKELTEGNKFRLLIPTCVSSVDLTVGQVACGTTIEVIDRELQSPHPEVTVPAGAPYLCDAIWVYPPEGTPGTIGDFAPISETTVLKGGDEAYIRMMLYPASEDSPGIFRKDPGVNINLNGAELVFSEIEEYEGFSFLYIVAKTNVVHVPGETKTENVVAPGCENAGSHDEVVYCEKCGGRISSKTVIDPALGHDWGAWNVVKKATATADGLKQRVCKRDASHVQTKRIPATGNKKKQDVQAGDIPKTGDSDPLGLWLALLGANLLALSGFGVYRFRLRKKNSR